jgi:AraC-like DNA-binding protein
MQFAGIVLTSGLTMMLAFMLPQWQIGSKAFSRSRWLMTAGTVLLPIQFLLQYTLHFRQMGVTQAVMVNLLFFIPSACLISLAVMNLLRQGRIMKRDWAVGAVTYLLVVTTLLIAAIAEQQPLLNDTPEMRTAEFVSAIFYLMMQAYYTGLNGLELRKLRRALEGYYDQDKGEILNWMTISVTLLGLSGLMAPIAIFWSGTWLLVYSLTIFFTIFYCVISFFSYGVDQARQKELSEAEESAHETGLNDETEETTMDDEERRRIEHAINAWVEQGGHLKNGINMAQVVKEIGVPRYMLTQWLKTTEWELFNPWLTYLRLEEAKKLLKAHPDWSNDTIAERCGFSSRSYFQTVFRKQTGMTPAQYIEK